MSKIQALGFGYIPEETKHHFFVVIPRSQNQKIAVYERFDWDDSEVQQSDIDYKSLKVRIDKHKWDLVKDPLQQEFNNTLRENNILVGRFKIGEIPVDRLLGKEMVLLLWAIEDSDPKLIPVALKNWLGLSREERWWLFTMTNAVTGQADDKRGWRKAIRYALTENPIDDEKHKQLNIFDLFK
ncbi:DUF3780 domain-containing protein [Halanaerobium sp.]|jgi:hypothetical protein|uniref:DUF3780 domain-containing protein n=1 Tax=Halanaerobium sp. TaxID=1895664 RepID=UPI000DE6DB33|nr:DUF3780 domain-containing protein [Halanaerobium sp.]PUU90433.1 MAG: hypothetical protein CI949_2342 [Halanaerobium sp.]